MTDPTSTPWLKLTSEFRSFLSGGQPQNPLYDGLQILSLPTSALWDDPITGSFTARSWANSISEWNLNYIARPGIEFDENYHIFLTSLLVQDPDPALQQAIQDDLAALQETANRRTRVLIAMGKEWKSFDKDQKEFLPPSEWLTFDAWKRQSGFPQQQSQIQAIYDAQIGQFGADAVQATDPLATALGDALTKYNMSEFQRETTSPDGIKELVRVWSFTPNLTTWIQEAASGAANSISLTIDHRTSTDVRSTFSVGGSLGFNVGIFGVYTQGGYTRTTIDTTSSQFKLEFKSSAFGGILVAPGPWFKGSVGSVFGDGPYKPGFSKNSWFGPNGDLNLITTILYIAYQPTIIMTLTNSNYNEVKTGWSAGGGISIGPFSFGASVGSQNDTITTDDQTRTITLESKSPHPQVVAVLNNVMPD
jgi:hypothetical protein